MSEQRYRTVAYVRVSTTDQTTSLDSQIRHFNEVMDTTPQADRVQFRGISSVG